MTIKKNKLDCPIIGLVYTEHITDTHTYYTLVPDAQHKMRVRSMDKEDEERNVVPCYLRKLAMPCPYDFAANAMQLEGERKEEKENEN